WLVAEDPVAPVSGALSGGFVFEVVLFLARQEEAAVLLPEVGAAPLVRAGIEFAHATPGDEQVELTWLDAAGVDDLHDHRLPFQGLRSEIMAVLFGVL